MNLMLDSKIKEMIPSYGLKLNEHEEVYNAVNKEVRKIFKCEIIEKQVVSFLTLPVFV